jgi:glutamate formiminotransferase/formiminotetrahydrofolate cyclodeaminase
MDSPAPGGGSVAALCGALSSALTSMVANLTVGKKDYEKVQGKVVELAIAAQESKDEFLRAVDLDTVAFNKVMDAFRMKKKTDEQKKERDAAIQEASKEATLVPLGVLEKSVKALELAKDIAKNGNKNSISDAGVAGLAAQTAAEGAYYNVVINLPDIQDEKFTKETRASAETLKKEALKISEEIRAIVREVLG